MKYPKLSFKPLFLALTLLLLPLFAFTQPEQVEQFDSEIEILKSGEIVVTETIDIYAKGNVFKRGIVRQLPRYRKNELGKDVPVDYEILSVEKDNSKSKYHTKKEGRYLSIYVGESSVYLGRNRSYSYELTYKVDGQIGYFEEYDELYWNVTGTDWDVPIKKASASIILPDGASEIQSSCYTGKYGSTARDCTISKKKNTVHFTTENIGNQKGLTIATGFTKGVVYQPPPPPPPTFLQKYGAQLMTAFFAFILLFYYLFTWRKYGIDPPKPTVVPQFKIPDNLSPASIGILHKGRYWTDLLTASIVSLAVKGYLKINEEEKKGFFGLFKDKSYQLQKLKDPSMVLPKEEQEVMNELFSHSTVVKIDGEYDPEIKSLASEYKSSIRSQWSSLLNQGNHYGFLIFPILTAGVYYFTFLSLFSFFKTPYLLLIFIGFLVINAILFLIYQWLIRKPAKEKLRLKSKIEGLKMYMGAAEEQQLQFFNPPEMSPEVFEKLLPYAIVLDVDKIWGEKFQDMLDRAGLSEHYNSTWTNYSGNNFGNFSHVMNSSLANSIAHSSTSPSSSSGSGGGGFSGGGGGGGGGGGW